MLSRLIVSALVLATFQAHGLNYGYHPESALSLGRGFNPTDLSVAKPLCLDYDGEERLDGEGALESNVEISLLQSQRDLYSKFGFSAEVSAQGFFAKGSAKTSFLDEYEFHEDTTHFAIVASTDHGRFGLKNPRLKTAYQKLIDEGKYEQFAKRCGTHYVFEVGRHSKVIAIYTIKHMNDERKRKFDASFDIAFSFADAKVKAAVESFNREAFKMNNVSLRVFAIGGSGLTELGDLVVNHMEPEKVKEVIRDYIAKMTDKRGVPSQFKADSMETFDWVNTQNIPSLKRDVTLKEYFFLIKGLLDKKSRLNHILLNRDTDFAHVAEKTIRDYASASTEIGKELDGLTKEATKCFDDANQCTMPTYEAKAIKWPVEAIEFSKNSRIMQMQVGNIQAFMTPAFSAGECESARYTAFLAKCITADELRDLRMLNGAPMCTVSGILQTWGLCE